MATGGLEWHYLLSCKIWDWLGPYRIGKHRNPENSTKMRPKVRKYIWYPVFLELPKSVAPPPPELQQRKKLYLVHCGRCRIFLLPFSLEIKGRKSAKSFTEISPHFSPISCIFFARTSLCGIPDTTSTGPCCRALNISTIGWRERTSPQRSARAKTPSSAPMSQTRPSLRKRTLSLKMAKYNPKNLQGYFAFWKTQPPTE